MTRSQPVDRRTVLKTTGGLLAGATLLASPGAAEDESLRLDVEDEIDLEESVFFAEVLIPDDNPLVGTDVDFQDATFLGLASEFELLETEDGTYVSLRDDSVVSNPVTVEKETLENSWRLIMEFSTENLNLSEVVGEEVTLGLGVFPEGREDDIPEPQFDTEGGVLVVD